MPSYRDQKYSFKIEKRMFSNVKRMNLNWIPIKSPIQMFVSAKILAIKLNLIPIFAITTVSTLVADNRLIPTIITGNKSPYES